MKAYRDLYLHTHIHMYQCNFYNMSVKISMYNTYPVAIALLREYEIVYHQNCKIFTHVHCIPTKVKFNFWFSYYSTTWLVLLLLTTYRNGGFHFVILYYMLYMNEIITIFVCVQCAQDQWPSNLKTSVYIYSMANLYMCVMDSNLPYNLHRNGAICDCLSKNPPCSHTN